MKKAVVVRCQRIGCDATLTEENNVEGSCRYHDSPIFHDGMKEWSCCKHRSHDFNLFLAIPGCKTGKHTTEKPVTKAVSASPQKPLPSVVQNKTTDANCSRCRQGFFCSDHGLLLFGHDWVPNLNLQCLLRGGPIAVETTDLVKSAPAPTKKMVDLNVPLTCKNKGCGKTFKEKDNHESACECHPGPAIFHDRNRGWKCCDIYVKEFDEFMNIPPFTKRLAQC